MGQVRQVGDDARGILQPALGTRRFVLTRHAPSPETSRFIRHHWSVEWDQGDEAPFRQAVLPHPVVDVVFAPGYANVYGLEPGIDVRTLEGRGWVLGALFRPAGFAPFWEGSIASLTGRVVPVASVFGAAGEAAWERILEASGPAERAREADRLFAGPDLSASVRLARDLAEEIAADHTLRRVDDVAARHGLSVRTVQRLFREHVGASPKWVIRRYRLYEAAERAGHGESVPWADVAQDLGYSDQAHLTREFTSMIGVSPAEYARACREGRPLPR